MYIKGSPIHTLSCKRVSDTSVRRRRRNGICGVDKDGLHITWHQHPGPIDNHRLWHQATLTPAFPRAHLSLFLCLLSYLLTREHRCLVSNLYSTLPQENPFSYPWAFSVTKEKKKWSPNGPITSALKINLYKYYFFFDRVLIFFLKLHPLLWRIAFLLWACVVL